MTRRTGKHIERLIGALKVTSYGSEHAQANIRTLLQALERTHRTSAALRSATRKQIAILIETRFRTRQLMSDLMLAKRILARLHPIEPSLDYLPASKRRPRKPAK